MSSLSYSAPVRIDLAGGTLDLWPIYLLLNNPLTINCAIDLYATAHLKSRNDSVITILSQDQNISLTYNHFSEIPENSELSLITRIINYYSPEKGFDLTLNCSAPKGSGLGGSSALNIAVNKVILAHCHGKNHLDNKKELIHIAQNIETSLLTKPTGVQDYYPALYGGLLEISYSAKGEKATALKIDSPFLEDHITLCYSGVSRLSITNNWEVYKAFLENKNSLPYYFQKISDASRMVKNALMEQSITSLASAINMEWTWRKKLYNGIENKKMKDITNSVTSQGALAVKACGAGGGGCMIIIHDQEKKKAVTDAIKTSGGTVLPFRIASQPSLEQST